MESFTSATKQTANNSIICDN